jgi:hypothetical protein
MNEPAQTRAQIKPGKSRRPMDPLLRLWVNLGPDLYWLVDLTHRAVTDDEIAAWESGQPVPKAQRERIAAAIKVFIDSGATLLGREAVRNARFATSPNFMAWSSRINKARRQLEEILGGSHEV